MVTIVDVWGGGGVADGEKIEMGGWGGKKGHFLGYERKKLLSR